jgi:CRISPR-associated protein Csb2
MQLRVQFLKEGYHGEEYPPSPYRLYQALVAGLYDQRYLAAKETVLAWLERLAPPIISASPALYQSANCVNYQPDNDNRILPDEAGVAHVRSGGQSLNRYVLPPEAEVVYTWEESGECPDPEALTRLAASVVYLGRSEDLVLVKADPDAAAIPKELRSFYPGENGILKLRVPQPGFLQECKKRYPQQHANFCGNHRLVKNVPYGLRRAKKAAPIAVFDIFNTKGNYLDFAPYQLRQLSGMVRGTMLAAASTLNPDPERVERLVAGHHANGLEHLAVVPIPSMDEGWNADGRLRKAAIIGYGLLDVEDGELFERLSANLDEAPLFDNGREVARLYARPVKSLGYMQNFLGGKSSRRWKSITPVVLHGFDSQKPLRKCLGLTASELEELEAVNSCRGPILRSSEHPMKYQVADHLAKWPRVHVDITFREERSGPFLLGRGKYVGLGLMVPVQAER